MHRSEDLCGALFRAMGDPEPPAELQSDAFLEGIYERAAAAGEQELGSILATGMTPLEAPHDVSWVEVDDRPDLADEVARALPGPERTPGFVWTRIRGGLQTDRERIERDLLDRKRRRGRVWQGAAAAVALVSLGLVAFNWPDDGTIATPTIVFELDPNLASPDDTLLGRSRIR